MINKFSFTFPLFFIATLATLATLATIKTWATEPDNCFRLEVSQGPYATADALKPFTQTWCYRSLDYPQGATFIFNGDGDKIRPELSAVLGADGILTHASLLKGEITVHRVPGDYFNPLQVPLKEPTQLQPEMKVFSQTKLDSAKEVLKILLDTSADLPETTIQEGIFQSSVTTAALPWRGYWWPYHNQPLSGFGNSPLAKYDRYGQGQTGQNPGAANWENTNHRYKGINWEGHCNGWAASAIIRPEPSASKFDSRSGVTFSVVDQKGILAEKDYCVNTAFYGRRYPGGPIQDIYPDYFHKVLTYYIGQLGKPVAYDHEAGVPVDNHILSGYYMTIKKIATNTYQVDANLNSHQYDSEFINTPGVAKTYVRTYRYVLRTDDRGKVLSGYWLSDNPDFLWVPLGPQDCPYNNQNMTETLTEQILALPNAN